MRKQLSFTWNTRNLKIPRLHYTLCKIAYLRASSLWAVVPRTQSSGYMAENTGWNHASQPQISCLLSLHRARQQSWELQGILITTYSSVVVSLNLTHIHMTFIAAEIQKINYINKCNREYFIVDCGHIVYFSIILQLRVRELLDNH